MKNIIYIAIIVLVYFFLIKKKTETPADIDEPKEDKPPLTFTEKYDETGQPISIPNLTPAYNPGSGFVPPPFAVSPKPEVIPTISPSSSIPGYPTMADAPPKPGLMDILTAAGHQVTANIGSIPTTGVKALDSKLNSNLKMIV